MRQPFGPRSQRCSRRTTPPPDLIGTTVLAVWPSPPRITTISVVKLSSKRPEAANHSPSAAQTLSCAFTQSWPVAGGRDLTLASLSLCASGTTGRSRPRPDTGGLGSLAAGARTGARGALVPGGALGGGALGAVVGGTLVVGALGALVGGTLGSLLGGRLRGAGRADTVGSETVGAATSFEVGGWVSWRGASVPEFDAGGTSGATGASRVVPAVNGVSAMLDIVSAMRSVPYLPL